MFTRFLSDKSGATAIEYGLICAGIALAILAALNTTGQILVEKLTFLLGALK
ncbi:MAG: Flp family type IVb pilin [Pseudolabrys sp.]